MTKFGRLLKWLILVPVLLVVALLSIANDHRVALRLNPFEPADPALQIDLALYQFGFAAFAAGARVWGVLRQEPPGPNRPQPAHRRKSCGRGKIRAVLQDRQGNARKAQRQGIISR